jgi:TP901 family phage tail tape measure protein
MTNGENLGSINYSVDVDYSALIAAGRAQDQFTEHAREGADQLDKTGRKAKEAARKVQGSADTMDRSFRTVTRTVQILGAAMGGLTLGRVANQFATFEQGMRNVSAVAGATEMELRGLSETALQAAATTRFNPGQTTQALYALASSGQNASEQMASLLNVLNLAEAGQADLGRATELTTSTLNQFGLTADQSGRVADVFVASIGASALNVNRLQVALRNAGPTAAALNQNLEGTTATIGMLTTAFGNGERAGTGFRAILNELPDNAEALGVAIRDANGQFRPFVDILADIEARGVTAGQAVEMFGAEAGPALAALLKNGSEALRTMEGRLTSNGQAAAVASSQLDTLRGDFDSLASSIDVAMIEIGASQSGMLRTSTQTVTNLVRLWSGYGDTLGDQRDTTQQLATAIETTVATAGGMAAVAVALRGAEAAQVAFNVAARANPYVLIATTIAGATAGIWAFTNAQETALEVWERAQRSEAAYQAAMANTQAANRIQEIARERLELQERLEEAQSRWIRNGTEEAAIKEELAALEREYHAITDARIAAERARGERQAEADAAAKAAKEEQLRLQQELLDQINQTLPAIGKTTDAYTELLHQLDPAAAALDRYFTTLEQIDALNISQQEADRLRALAYEEHWQRMADIAGKGSKAAAEEAGEEFENAWQGVADGVAQSLQDAIASGDWDGIGDAIGNALATSASSIVNKTITDELSKGLTKDSGMLAQIGAAFAGPIAGAVAGGAIQLAVSELSDFFSGSDWDPTEARQAAQGTGTILGSIDAKSESIAKAVDISAGASRELVGINRDMLRALQTLQLGIAGASGMVARSYGGINFTAQDLFSQTDMAGAGMLLGVSAFGLGSLGAAGLIGNALGPIGGLLATGLLDGAIDFVDNLAGGLFSDIGGSIFGGKTDVKDVGIQFFGATLDEMIRGWRDGDRYLTAQAYATIKRDGGWFGSDKRWDEYQRLDTEAENQISQVFGGIRDSVVAGAEALGMSSTEIQSALDTFRVETQKISLEGLSAEEQTAELEAVFSSIFDQAAGAVVPYLDDFQRAGEGLGETLARVATQVQVTEQAVDMLGLQFSDLAGAELIEASQRLVELNGGMEQFISGMQNFIGNFATEAQQFEINANALAQGMGDLPLPETRDGFWALMQAQDAATEEGAENIATLLRLQGTADAYYSAIEKAQGEAQKAQEQYYATEISGQRSRLQEAQRANRAVQSAMDSMLFQSSAVQEASRQSALRTLEQIANAGRVSDIGQLQNALDAATQIDSGRYSTFADYAREYARTAGAIGRVGEVTQTAEDREARMLRSLESQLEAVKGMREDLERTQLAIIKQTNKTAKILERFEIDGIEVRA